MTMTDLDTHRLGVRQVLDLRLDRNPRLLQELDRAGPADPEDEGQADIDSLAGG